MVNKQFFMLYKKNIILFLCCAVTIIIGSGCSFNKTQPSQYLEITNQKFKDDINKNITSLYPDRFKAIHRVILTFLEKEYVLDGYLFVDRPSREVKLIAQNDLGGIIFDVHFIKNVEKTIHSNISMLGEKRLEKSVLRDLETLYLEEPFPSPTLFSDQHKNFVLSQKEGPITKELIYKQINGHVRYRLNEIRHLENKKCVYTISLKYGTGSNNLYPEFIVIQDISMKYKLQINVRYII